jgi:hypothetical protein
MACVSCEMNITPTLFLSPSPKDCQVLKPVKSSNVHSVGYNPATQSMDVQFKGGGKVYRYSDVPSAVHDNLHKAPSIGKFISANIVGKFKHHTIDMKDYK